MKFEKRRQRPTKFLDVIYFSLPKVLLLHASEVLKIYSFPWAWASTTKDLFNTDVCTYVCLRMQQHSVLHKL